MSLTSLDGIRRSKASLEAFIGSRTAAHFGPSSTPETRPFDPRISIVIPTLNEASNLPFVFSTIASLDAEVIVVDGRSSDDTVRVAKALRDDVVVVHEIRRGKGAALQAGFAAATGDIIVMLDSDGSADGREIPAFVDALRRGADFAKGSRFISGGGSADITLIRQTGNSFLSKLVSATFGANSLTSATATTHSGVTACRTSMSTATVSKWKPCSTSGPSAQACGSPRCLRTNRTASTVCPT